jgi:LUD domain
MSSQVNSTGDSEPSLLASAAAHTTVASTASEWPLRASSIPARRPSLSSTCHEPHGRNINGVKSAYASSAALSPREDQPMSTIATPDRFTTLPDEPMIASAVTALEEHGFSVEVVDDLDAARQAVLARIPDGSSVMTNTSVTLQETGIADAINGGGHYDSARNRMFALDFATQAQEMKAIGGQPDYALGSVHAVTQDGTLVIASASGSQLASYAWGAANVILVVGAQKLVPTLEAAHQRIYQHSLVLEDARAIAAYGQHSSVGKILEIHQELPGRIHIVLIRQAVGF